MEVFTRDGGFLPHVENKLQQRSRGETVGDGAGKNQNEPVTVLVTRKPRPGREAEFEAVIEGFGELVGRFPGFLGLDILRPTKLDDQIYHVILRFDHRSNFELWESSSEYIEWRSRAEALTEPKSKRVERVNGLEAWFTLPERDGAPPKWKTAVASAIGIYPLIMFVPDLLNPVTIQLPKWLGTLIVIVVLSPLITWIAMPFVTWILGAWLYRSKSE